MPPSDVNIIDIPVELSLLKRLIPIRDLQPDDRRQMAVKSHIIDLWAGDELTANEEHRWLLYLLEGKVDLLEPGQSPQLIHAGDVRSHHPLFPENQYQARMVAQTRCNVIRFDKQLFTTLLEHELISGEELQTIEIGEIEGNIFNEIMHAFNMGRLKLPSLPEIAVKVKMAVSNPNVDVDDVARIVEADPALAARLIQVANSPLTRGYEIVRSIKDAIVRLGLAATRNLVIGLSVKQLFKSKSPLLNARMHDLYDHSIEIAAISFALSKQAKKFDPDHLLLAGLVHDIGVIPVLTYIEETGLEINNAAELDDIIEKLRSIVGSLVIRHWELSNDLVTVVEDAENWHRDSRGELDVCDLIIVAQIYSMLKHHKVKGLPPMDAVPAFNKLFSGKPAPEFASQVLEQAHEEIVQVMQLLKL
ncbi:MAG: HDOD domain-containing protein [Gammaproteobacteria bacterium]|nr:HDOD domain-containing protein [Gammaproteobacteria bacterium]